MIETISPGRAPRTFRKYSNFRDPFGLVWRMLTSGNRAAYDALLRAGLSTAAVPVDWLLQRRERARLLAADPRQQRQPVVLIVGPPRSGSTLVYQTLARYLNVSYISNLTALFPRAPITATRWLQGRGASGGADFQSYYGQTAGLSAPNDGFEVWNRWLGGDRYATLQALDDAATEQIRRFFSAWSDAFEVPFLNKNNRNTQCIQLLAAALPTASFLVLRRDPVFVAQSLLEARVRVQGAKDRSWGLASTEQHARANEPLGYVDDVCDQLLTIERQLQAQTAAVAPSRVVETTYEEFCRSPHTILEQLVSAVPGLGLRPSAPLDTLQPFRISATLRLTDAERTRIEQRLSEALASGTASSQHHVKAPRHVPS